MHDKSKWDSFLELGNSFKNRPVIVFLLLMAVSIGSHMVYYEIGKDAWQGPVFGPYHRPAINLLTWS